MVACVRAHKNDGFATKRFSVKSCVFAVFELNRSGLKRFGLKQSKSGKFWFVLSEF